MTEPDCLVLDTNILVVAEGLNEDAPRACQAACIEVISQLREGVVVAVDSGGEVVLEYLRALRGSPTSNLGVKLAKRLQRMSADPKVCKRVEITPCDPPGSYEEVPISLRDFDTDDQKFIAVAAADPSRPEIYTGVDGEWWERRRDFVDAGIDVQFPCGGYLRNRDG